VRQPLPPSLYADTARPAIATPPLDGDRRVSVAIVGGGFTGLSTALHLAEKGVDVVVLEAREPGWGASGRNGGQVNPGLKHDPDDIETHFGPDLGRRMVELSWNAPKVVFDLATRHQSSSGEGSHLSALTEPDGTLSRHPAPTLRPPVVHRVPTRQTAWGPVARCIPASALTRVPGV